MPYIRFIQQGNISPLMAIAMGSVILASGVVVSKQMGWIHGNQNAQNIQTQMPPDAATHSVTTENHSYQHRPEYRHERHEHPEHRTESAAIHTAEDVYPNQPIMTPTALHTQPAPPCPDCAVITTIRQENVAGKDSGLGAVAGGIAGGVMGHQVGHGNGKTVATVLGALGGLFAGNKVEEHERSKTVWVVAMRMENGSEHQLTLTQSPNLSIGEPVRLNGNTIIPR